MAAPPNRLRIGRGVRFFAKERVDLPDMMAIAELASEPLPIDGGSLLGSYGLDPTTYAGGVGTYPTFNTTDVAAIQISKCVLIGVESSSDGKHSTSQKMHYDPALSIQTGFKTVNLSGYTNADRPWLWWRREETNTDIANRRGFNNGSNTEVTVSTEPTITSEYVRFAHSSARGVKPSMQSGWYPFAQVKSWTAGKPNIEAISIFDAGHVPATDGDSFVGQSYLGKILFGLSGGSGLVAQMRALTMIVCRLIDEQWEFNFANGSVTTAGVAGLLDVTTQIGARQTKAKLSPLFTEFNALPTRGMLHGHVTRSGGLSIAGGDAANALLYNKDFAASKQSTGVYHLTCDDVAFFNSSSVYAFLDDSADVDSFIRVVSDIGDTAVIHTFNNSGAAADRQFRFIVMGHGAAVPPIS